VAFSAPYPGKIIRMPLQNGAMLCQRGSFLCADGDINITVEFTKRLGAGFFGGEGFILERFEGSGELFVHSGGTIVPFELKAGETLKVDTGCLVAFDPTVVYDIEFVGGIKTALFGGEGLFFAAMTGPGRVWVQTLPFSRLADRVLAAFHGGKEETRRGDLGGALGAIGDLIGGDR
ncbi:MAG: TIGR00266 family protein, partial [Acidobacteria bacterium]